MDNRSIDERFDEAVDIANTMSQAELPQDVQLRLYALYKQSTLGRAKSLPAIKIGLHTSVFCLNFSTLIIRQSYQLNY